MRKPLKDCEYICRNCARYYGGKWPEGHVATCFEGLCDACGQVLGVCNVGDWDWPDGESHGMRD